jgi:hypothetical protein
MEAAASDTQSKFRRVFTAREKLFIIEETKTLGFNNTLKKYKLQGTQITKWRKNIDDLRRISCSVSLIFR